MVSRSSFDLLVDNLAKAIHTRTPEKSEEDGFEVELHPMDAAFIKVMKRMSEALVAQDERIRALKARLTALEGSPSAPLAKAVRQAAAGDGFLLKAEAALIAGKISGHDVAIAEQYINAGAQPPADIIRAVVAAEFGV